MQKKLFILLTTISACSTAPKQSTPLELHPCDNPEFNSRVEEQYQYLGPVVDTFTVEERVKVYNSLRKDLCEVEMSKPKK